MANEDKSNIEQLDQSRRSFLNKLWLTLGGVAAAGLASVVVAFLRPREIDADIIDSSHIFEAGHVDRFEPGSVTAFVRGRFYLCCLDDGGFLALSRTCTHLGCTVPWVESEKKFKCPCHASAFDITGEVLSPPAPRALELYRVVIENNIVKVDTHKTIRRSGFKAEQVVYSKKA
jgi:cytochrome b6-f complex iron-sulfur subunit